MTRPPVIIVNFKTFAEATGERAVSLAKLCEDVSEEHDAGIAVAPQAPDIFRVSSAVDIPVYAQHIDWIQAGSYTGHVLAECVREAGATGTLINHSERRLSLADIDSCIRAARRTGLMTVVCTNNIATTAAAAGLNPDFVAIEPPELIGSGVPVSNANPDIVKSSVEAAKRVAPDVEVLCGAGISKGEDVRAALALGTSGVLLASGVVRAKDQRSALLDLAGGVSRA
ncbi:MAG TPA: triose-phosphate isomerase [Candidatus Methanoperedenaceae archaeon]|nr:triose-phosphate isomerase [Candidatus Methanoperedenaceae archaeon]